MSTTRQQTSARAANERAITDTCALAGKPERAAAYIAAGTDARTVLTELRGEQPTATASRAGWRDAVARVNRDHLARAGGR